MIDRPEALRIAGFPGRYLQGPGAINMLPHVVRGLGGHSALVVSDVLSSKPSAPDAP